MFGSPAPSAVARRGSAPTAILSCSTVSLVAEAAPFKGGLVGSSVIVISGMALTFLPTRERSSKLLGSCVFLSGPSDFAAAVEPPHDIRFPERNSPGGELQRLWKLTTIDQVVDGDTGQTCQLTDSTEG